MDKQIILTYFPNLTDVQIKQFDALGESFSYWNQRVNVISRKDIDNLYVHHVLHSLAIAKEIQFVNGSQVLDLGTGGGFPAIPLAILFPETHFVAIDGTRKKIQVVKEISSALGIENIEPIHVRAEELKKRKFDFVVTRAVASIEKLYNWSRPLLSNTERNAYPNGVWALKGGDIKKELKLLPKGTYTEKWPIHSYYKEQHFLEKWLIYVQK